MPKQIAHIGNILFSLCVLVSCNSPKRIFIEDILGGWTISEFISRESIDFTSGDLIFISEDSCSVPLLREMPLHSTEGHWKVIQSSPPIIEIECQDTIFSGIWEIRNIKRSHVPQHARFIRSFELYQPNISFTFERLF